MKKDNALFNRIRSLGKKKETSTVARRTSSERKNPSVMEVNIFGGQVSIANDKGTVNAASDGGTVNAGSSGKTVGAAEGKQAESMANGRRKAGIAMDQEEEKHRLSNEIKFSNNKKEKYIKNWNSRLFLHLDNDECPLTLADAFIMPEGGYRIKLGRIEYSDKNAAGSWIRYSSKDTVGDLINKYIKCERNSNMLITGVPGIGKSTITSWIAYQHKNDDRCIILRFRDWDAVELEDGLLCAICSTLECKKKDLENKVLVLDGFDEMKALDIREEILNTFLNDIKDIEDFRCIITSRPAYVDAAVFYNRIDILPFNMDKIRAFYMKITGVPLKGNIIDDNTLDVLGVPVILYMAIMSKIDITERTSKPELYNRIFAEEGGIFDRFCEYDSGSQILRNPQNIRRHLEFLREIAFMMFEKNDLQIQKGECKIPELEYQGKSVSILEFPIKHLFEDTNRNIEFIHGSIYEYFVSEYIAVSLMGMLGTSIENMAGTLGNLLKRNRLSIEILEFLKFKINGRYKGRFNLYYFIKAAFQIMLRDGMTYYTNEHYKNANICEMNVFINMLEIIHLWEFSLFQVDPHISDYLRYNVAKLNLKRFDLKEVDLSGIHLNRASLLGANLSVKIFDRSDFSYDELPIIKDLALIKSDLKLCNLKNIVFRNVNFCESDLRESDFSGSDIRGINLTNAILENLVLENTIISEDQIECLKKNDLSQVQIFVKEEREIISYREYRERKRGGYFLPM